MRRLFEVRHFLSLFIPFTFSTELHMRLTEAGLLLEETYNNGL